MEARAFDLLSFWKNCSESGTVGFDACSRVFTGISRGEPGDGGVFERVVVELRNRDTPFLLQHQQRIFRFQLHRNLAIPDVLYGQLGSHYQGQGLRLAKQFA